MQDLYGGNSSLLIYGKEGKVAVDLSCNIAALVEADIDSVILTHEHIDHVYALPSLLHQLWISGRTKELKIYIPDGLEVLVNTMIDMFKIRSKKDIFDIQILTDTSWKSGSLHITTFKTDHTNTSTGVVVEEENFKLVYTGDSRPLKEFPQLFEGANILIHEASGLEENEETLIKKGHSSGADAGRAAAGLRVKELYLCHLPKGKAAQEKVLKEAKIVFSEVFIPEILKEYIVM